MTDQTIEEGKQGCHIKSQSWFNDKGVQLAVREFISCSGDKLSAHKLAKAVGEYLGSKTVTSTVENILKQEASLRENNTHQLHPETKIKVKTAQRWLKKTRSSILYGIQKCLH